MPDNTLSSNGQSSLAIDPSLSVLEVEDNPLFISPSEDMLTHPEMPSRENTSQDEDVNSISEGSPNENPQPGGSTDVVMGLPTPSSNPGTEVSEKTNHCKLK